MSQSKPGSRLDQQIDARLVIIGSGPGGLAAAVTAAGCAGPGDSIVIVDEQGQPGGQIWRGPGFQFPQAQKWFHGLENPAIRRIQGQVVGEDASNRLIVETETGVVALRTDRIILATGARERFLPFPGWTLPGIFGIGGLQAMMKTGWPVEGRRIVIAGSGPLMFPVASTALDKGAQVVTMAEQAPLSRLARFALHLPIYPEKAWEALGFLWKLWKVPQNRGVWVRQAGGNQRLEWVELTNGKRTWKVDCEILASGYHLLPNTELASLFGCRIDPRGSVAIDDSLRTSRPGIFAVGECTGVGGADRALVQGILAAWIAMGQEKQADFYQRGLDRWNAFSRLLDETFAPRPEVTRAIGEDTVVCRCEDIPHGRLKGFTSWREAKLQTRCGMGPCQGRICGPAVEALFGWGMESVRPPVLPCRGDTLVTWSEEKEAL